MKDKINDQNTETRRKTDSKDSQLRQLDKQSCSTGHSSAEVSPQSKNRAGDSMASSIFTSTVKEDEQLTYEDLTEEMNMRWLKLI